MVATAPYAALVAPTGGLAGNVKTVPFVVTFDDVALVDEIDVIIGKLPAHALVIGGWLVSEDLDVGTEVLELDFGWAANGGAQTDTYVDPFGVSYDNSGYQASQTGLVDSGALLGDAVAGLPVPAGLNYRPILLAKPLYFKLQTNVLMHVEVPANTQAAGTLTLYVQYLLP
jgi:hypothetical protein